MKKKLSLVLCLVLVLACIAPFIPSKSNVYAATTWNNTADVSWIDSSKKIVAFAFDDGPTGGSAATRILNTLQQYSMHATFFYQGNRITSSNASEIQRAFNNGNEIANHTWSHPYLTNLSTYQIQQEVDNTTNQLRNITGQSSAKYLVRPPYLATNQTVFNAIDTPLITCSVDSQDWNNASTQTIINNVLGGVQDGSILLMHETYDTTAAAVEYLVPELINRGYVITSISELFKMKGKTMYSGQVYSSCPGSNVVNNTPTTTPTAAPTATPTPTTTPSDPSTPAATTIADGLYYIKSVSAQKYLQVSYNTGNNGQNVEIYTGTGVDGQKWYVRNNADGSVTFISKLGSYSLDVANASADDGANVQIYSSYDGDAQKFYIRATSTNGVYTIASKCSGGTKYLDVAGYGTADATNVQQYSANGNTNQQWIFEKAN